MDRRTFLKATLATAGGLIAGCGDDETGPTPTDAGPGGHDMGADLDMGGGDPIPLGDPEVGGGDPDALSELGADADAGFELVEGSAFFPQSVASGDPKSDSVILWTRVWDDTAPDQDVAVSLEVALDEAFEQRIELNDSPRLVLTAEAGFDHCVKVRLGNLDAMTAYHYRFIYERDGVHYVSRPGRTATAPAADADVPVRFAFVSCQDYNGRFFNTYRRLLQEDVAFVVHLGDYVYETTGDPIFQEQNPDRTVTFSDPGSAIVFNEGTDSEYYAAKSLGNYRDLYKTFRSDSALQAAHERFPFIIVWDDHEFSDDNFGATATYYDGRADEYDVNRKKAANQAWFEYMPVDYLDDPEFRYDPAVTYPDDLTIYRDFEFGAHLHLVMTDERSYRTDHLLPEGALPGAVVMDEDALVAALGVVPDFASEYVDIESFGDGLYQTVLIGAAESGGYDPALITGDIDVDFINGVVEEVNSALPEEEQVPLIEGDDLTGLPRGMAYTHLGKTSAHGAVGSRYLVIKDTFNILSATRFAETGGASEMGLGDAQRAWFLDAMRNSSKTWKVWGNEYCLIPRTVDVSGISSLPDVFRQIFSLSAEDWDGLPTRRDELIGELADVGNVVAITGDIHAFFAGTASMSGDTSKKIPEFVTAGVSSASYQELLVNQANASETLRNAGVAALAMQVAVFLGDKTSRANPHLGHIDVTHHGFGVVDVSADSLEVEFFAIDQGFALEALDDDAIDANFSSERFRVDSGSSDLHKWVGGEWLRWDSDLMDWV